MISQYIVTLQPTVSAAEGLFIVYYNQQKEIIGVTVNSFGHLIWLTTDSIRG